MKTLTATNSLVALCILIFISGSYSGLLNEDLLALYYHENPNYQIWQLFSHLFIHGGFFHLFVNMFGLYIFGSIVERHWGAARFLGFYFACGLGAALIYEVINIYEFQAAIEPSLATGVTEQQIIEMFSAIQYRGQYFPGLPGLEEAFLIFAAPVVGASGALYGILVAFACLFPNHKMMLIFLPVPVAAKYFMPVLLGIEVLSGITGFSIFGSNIAHWAHIGGAITGFIIMLLVLLMRRIN